MLVVCVRFLLFMSCMYVYEMGRIDVELYGVVAIGLIFVVGLVLGMSGWFGRNGARCECIVIGLMFGFLLLCGM